MNIDKNINKTGEREKLIVGTINDVKASNLSVPKYFSTHDIPFTIRQYYTYLKRYNEEGVKGLYDHREYGNAKKITSEIEYYLIGLLENNRELSVLDVISRLQEKFNINLKKTAINDFRKKHGLERIDNPVQEFPFAGFEILSALAYHTKIFDVWSNTIRERIENAKESDIFKENQKIGADHPFERNKGKFTSDYDRLEDVRKTKLNSISDKVCHKDLSRLQVLSTETKTISRKILRFCHCLLSL